MTNLNNKYKERAPLETIHIIKTFFESKGYKTQVFNSIQSEAGSWHCRIELLKNEKQIITTYGKGVNEIFSLASGYAELFETFCNKCVFVKNPILTEAQSFLSQKKYGYMFHPKEKKLNIIEALDQSIGLRDFYTQIFQGNMYYMATFINLITSNEIIGEPYKSLTNPEETPYYDQRLNIRLTGSIGMAAGNTQEEALNQGISEICEHIARDAFFNQPQKKYYKINLSKINNPELLKMIDNIHKAGSEIYIYDLSYNFNMPVFMSIIINKKTKRSYVNFGSFPVAEIGIERVITENYQGIETFNLPLEGNQIPYKNLDIKQIQKLAIDQNLKSINFIDENILLNKTITVDEPNPQIYINNNVDNFIINNYYKELFHKLNLSIHYIENSPIKEMSAVNIFIPEYHYINNNLDIFKEKNLHFNLTAIMRYYKLIHEILFNYDLNDNIHYKRIVVSEAEFENNKFNGVLMGILTACDWLTLYGNSYGIILNTYNYNAKALIGTIFAEKYSTYYLLCNYISTKKYTNQELINIFNKIYNYNITEEDIINCHNPEYRFNKCFIETIRNFYFSQEHQEIIESFIRTPDMI